MSQLASKQCVPCKGGVPPLKGDELNRLSEQVEGWDVIEGHELTFGFQYEWMHQHDIKSAEFTFNPITNDPLP